MPHNPYIERRIGEEAERRVDDLREKLIKHITKNGGSLSVEQLNDFFRKKTFIETLIGK